MQVSAEPSIALKPFVSIITMEFADSKEFANPPVENDQLSAPFL